MKFLEAMEMIQYIMKLMEVGNRVQVSKEKVEEMSNTLAQIMILIGQDASPQLQSYFEDTFSAASATKSISISVLTDEMKDTISKGLNKIKEEVAALAFEHFTVNDFEPTEEIIPLMRQVVALHYGGVDID